MLHTFLEQAVGVDLDLKNSPLLRDMRYLTDSEKRELFKAQIMSFSVNTVKNYALRCKVFFNFSKQKSDKVFPVRLSLLNLFLLKEGNLGKSIGSLKYFIASLDFFCKIFGYGTVGAEKTVKLTLKFLEKMCKKVTRYRRPFTLNILEKLFENIDKHGGIEKLNFIQLRTLIMITVCYYSLMRFDDIKKIELSNIIREPEFFKFNIIYSKTDQPGHGQSAYVVSTDAKYDPYILVKDYLKKLESLGSNFLLPSMKYCKKNRNYVIDKKPVTYSTSYNCFKKLLLSYEIDPKHLSLHSCRSGGTTDDFKNKLDHRIIDKKGRWKNKNTKFLYCKESDEDIVKMIKKSYKK